MQFSLFTDLLCCLPASLVFFVVVFFSYTLSSPSPFHRRVPVCCAGTGAVAVPPVQPRQGRGAAASPVTVTCFEALVSCGSRARNYFK